jgi:hypothetical protein
MNPPKKTASPAPKNSFPGVLNPQGPKGTYIPRKNKALAASKIDYNGLNDTIIDAIADMEAAGTVLRQQLFDADITGNGITDVAKLDLALFHRDWEVWNSCLRTLSVKASKLATLSSTFLNDEFELTEDMKTGKVYRSQKDLDSLFSL